MSPIIKVRHVWKRYRIHELRTLYKQPASWKRVVSGLLRSSSGWGRYEAFWALRDVSLEMNAGEVLGIIGPNGAGKTTLLRLMAGITRPTRGYLKVKGRIGALISVGAGFHPELTGRENIYLNGAIMGMSKREIDRKFDTIVDFAEIEDFLEMPLKHYSSGMYARLGFSVAVHVEPEVLLIDEVLAVGDYNFYGKCIKRMRQLASEGRTVVFVSHSMPAVRSLCPRIAWIDSGQLQLVGEAGEVIAAYLDAMNRRALNQVGEYLRGATRRGTGEVRFARVETLDAKGRPCTEFRMGETIRIRAHYRVVKTVDAPRFGFAIRDPRTGAVVTSINSFGADTDLHEGQEGVIECVFSSIPLRPRRYTLYLGIARRERLVHPFDIWDGAGGDFTVTAAGLDSVGEFVVGDDQALVSIPYEIHHFPDGISSLSI